jgi:hypothetical protein
MPREPIVFFELRRGIAFMQVQATLAPKQEKPRFTHISIEPIGILLTWDALARCGFGAKDLIRLCEQEVIQILNTFVPAMTPGYARMIFTCTNQGHEVDTRASIQLTICYRNVSVRSKSQACTSADIIPLFSHSYGEDAC